MRQRNRMPTVVDEGSLNFHRQQINPAAGSASTPQRGENCRALQFDPEIVDLLLEHLDSTLALRVGGEAPTGIEPV